MTPAARLKQRMDELEKIEKAGDDQEQVNAQYLIDCLRDAIEALEYVASFHLKEAESVQFWLNKGPVDSAITCAGDAEVARQFFARWGREE